MARPSKETPRPSRLAPALLAFARENGLGHALLAMRIGLDASAVNRDECAATAAAIHELLTEIAEALGEPHLALRLPHDLPRSRYELPELAARSSPDARAALVHIAKYASLVHGNMEGSLDGSVFTIKTPAHPRGVGRHACEYALADAMTNLRAAGGEDLVAARVWFSHARPTDLSPLHRFFGTTDLQFGMPDSGFVIAEDLLARKSSSYDARMLATAEGLAESELAKLPREASILALVSRALTALLPNDATIDAAAHALHLSARTLQRRLESNGLSFSEVLDSVRREEAERLLADDVVPLAEIAKRLGFSDLATFSRAWKRWTGKPPGAYRDAMRRRLAP